MKQYYTTDQTKHDTRFPMTNDSSGNSYCWYDLGNRGVHMAGWRSDTESFVPNTDLKGLKQWCKDLMVKNPNFDSNQDIVIFDHEPYPNLDPSQAMQFVQIIQGAIPKVKVAFYGTTFAKPVGMADNTFYSNINISSMTPDARLIEQTAAKQAAFINAAGAAFVYAQIMRPSDVGVIASRIKQSSYYLSHTCPKVERILFIQDTYNWSPFFPELPETALQVLVDAAKDNGLSICVFQPFQLNPDNNFRVLHRSGILFS